MKNNTSTFFVSMVNGKSELKVFPETTGALTSRENEILDLLINGLKRPKIAATLSISTATVDTHMKHIHSKMTVHSDVELIARALKDKVL
jgi:DNA-binding NarL/FixJ family response regulator